MLKAAFYLGLTGIGIIAALFSPLAGAIACIEAYLFNPKALSFQDWDFRYQLCTTVAFIIGLLIHRPRPAERVNREATILWLVWAFLGVCVLSATWAQVTPSASLDAASDLAKTVLMATALLWAIRSESDLSWLMTAFLVGVLHAGLLHTFGFRLGFLNVVQDRDLGVLIQGQSQVMAMFVPLLIVMIVSGTRIQRLLAAVALPFAMNSIVKSYQRTSFLALLVDAILLLLFLPRRIVLRLLPVFAVAAGVFMLRLTPENYWNWMKTIEDPNNEASAASRFTVAHASWQIFQDYPLGVGYKNYQYVSPRYLPAESLTEGRRSSHNSYFTVLCEMGVQGFVPWSGAILIALFKLRRIRKTSDPKNLRPAEYSAVAIEIGLYAWLVTGLFGDQSNLDPAYWFLALTVVLVRLTQSTRHAASADDVDAPLETQVGYA
jgi:O-antigen ligase